MAISSRTPVDCRKRIETPIGRANGQGRAARSTQEKV